jgi:hypothetical protein
MRLSRNHVGGQCEWFRIPARHALVAFRMGCTEEISLPWQRERMNKAIPKPKTSNRGRPPKPAGEKFIKTRVTVPYEDAMKLRALVPKGKRSAFMREAIFESLREIERLIRSSTP